MTASTPSHEPARSRLTLRQRQAELTRSSILDAARRLFAEQGYAGTSVRPIAAEAGVAVQTLYTTFGSKQGMLLALVEAVRAETRVEELGEEIRRSDDPRRIVELAARIRRRTLELGGDVVRTFREGAAGDAEVAAVYDETKRRTREGIAAMCARLDALGALRPSLAPGRAADQVAALFAAEVYEELTGPLSRWTPDEYEAWLTERFAEMLLRPDLG